MKWTIRQQKIINAPEDKILCLAGAGSGKTGVLTERFRHLIEDLKVPPEKIAAVTFTNMAAEEMRERLGDIAKKSFIGTIHSLANLTCNKNSIDTVEFLMREEYDKLLDIVLTIPAYKYPKYEYLFVDEAQDLNRKTFCFLDRFPLDNKFFCGDDRQAIYSFNGSSDEFIERMARDKSYKKYFLTEDFRNPSNIITYAEGKLGKYQSLSPHNYAMKKREGIISECTFFEAVENLKEIGDWGQWFVLTRSNKQLEDIGNYFKELEIPYVTFKQGNLSNTNELNTIVRSNAVKLLTIHSSKGLSASNVIVVGSKLFNLDERRLAYVAATRAEQNLYWCPAPKLYSTKKATKAARRGVIMF